MESTPYYRFLPKAPVQQFYHPQKVMEEIRAVQQGETQLKRNRKHIKKSVFTKSPNIPLRPLTTNVPQGNTAVQDYLW